MLKEIESLVEHGAPKEVEYFDADEMTSPSKFEADDGIAISDSEMSVETPDSESEPVADEVTGASPGTAQACKDLGLNSLKANLAKLGIKPPGVA